MMEMEAQVLAKEQELELAQARIAELEKAVKEAKVKHPKKERKQSSKNSTRKLPFALRSSSLQQ